LTAGLSLIDVNPIPFIKEDAVKTRPIAIICSAAALSMAAAPIAAAAAGPHPSPDRSKDRTHHVDRSRDARDAHRGR
jgi:hypothetical protein